MIKMSSKFVPRILADEQNEVRMEVCQNMIEMTRIDPEWSQKIITREETWVYLYDPEIKCQSNQLRKDGTRSLKKQGKESRISVNW
ncbi:hypothetical protein LAZ67_16001472 [Cordylochernes scorpioides]|uniref:Uncharacterized protein n=1 Tax=Cordylochernes scorpioides TaxID=51811 RepID=A0ABY6LBP4_9ARAC|nr:hypothetical protein LAZ67_16001472 [Cordylochernes scorpioides]